MSTRAIAIDPVLAVRARIEAVHDAAEAAPRPRQARIYGQLPALWDELSRTRPTTNAGAAILFDEARDYEGNLEAEGVYLPHLWDRTETKVASGTLSAKDIRRVAIGAEISRKVLGDDHPMGRMLDHVAAFAMTSP